MKFKLTEIKPQCFLVTSKDQYDLNMLFVRYQEFYESHNPKFRGKNFKLLDFMEWYAKSNKRTGCKNLFSYPQDWAGFNIPSYVLEDIKVSDWNKYDEMMSCIYNTCINHIVKNHYESDDFYLIGALEGNELTVNHEVAHALFYLNSEYQSQMTKLVKSLSKDFRTNFYETLMDIGYTKGVLVDEAQAFLATGWRDIFPLLQAREKPFVKIFNEYNVPYKPKNLTKELKHALDNL